MTPVITRTLSADHITPVRAYAALRSHAKERSSFLIEAAPFGAGGGRYSVLGYRARREAMYPGGGGLLRLLADDLKSEEVAESFAARMSQGLYGFISYDFVHALHKVEPWANEGEHARMLRDATVVVFDHAAQTLTIAGASPGALNRCEWEMTHGPEMRALAFPDRGHMPEGLDIPQSDAAFAEKVRKALRFLAASEQERLILARTFRAPERGADMLDIYRALKLLSPSRHHFFFEFGASPMAEAFCVVGASSELVARVKDGQVLWNADGEIKEQDLQVALREAGYEDLHGISLLRSVFPIKQVVGSRVPRITEIIRRLETAPRRIWGGAVGFACPGGDYEFVLARTAIVQRHGYVEVLGATDILRDTDAESSALKTVEDARSALAAIRAGQDAAAQREEEAEKKRIREAEAAAKAAEAVAAVKEGEEPPKS